MIRLTRTDADSPDFRSLVSALDKHLAVTDGEEHAFYDQYNKLDHIKNVIVAYEGNVPVGCGAIKEFEDSTYEVKRMYVRPDQRGKGIATSILNDLENWSRELNASHCVLETGIMLESAVRLYKKQGYKKIPSYGQYENMPNSVCLKKEL